MAVNTVYVLIAESGVVHMVLKMLLNETSGHVRSGFMISQQAKSCRILLLGKVSPKHALRHMLVSRVIANPIFAWSNPGWKVTYGC